VEKHSDLTSGDRLRGVEFVGAPLRCPAGYYLRHVAQHTILELAPSQPTSPWLAVHDEELFAETHWQAARARDDCCSNRDAPVGHSFKSNSSDVGAVPVPRLDEDVEHASAHPVCAHRNLVSQVDHYHARLFVFDDLECRSPHLGLAAATADCALG